MLPCWDAVAHIEMRLGMGSASLAQTRCARYGDTADTAEVAMHGSAGILVLSGLMNAFNTKVVAWVSGYATSHVQMRIDVKQL